MKSRWKYLGFLAFALSLSLMSCKGEDGPIGPVGPAGIAGMDGQDGAAGEKGEKGDEGNANVITSEWIDLVWDNPNSTFGLFQVEAPEFTEEILSTAVILVYVRQGGSTGTYYTLPRPFDTYTGLEISFVYGLNLLTYFYFADVNADVPDFECRYVIIPPAGRLAAEREHPKESILQEFSDAGVDLEDYDQVAKYLELR